MHKEIELNVIKISKTKTVLISGAEKIEIANTLMSKKTKVGDKLYITISTQKDNKIELLNKLLEE